MRGSTTLLDNIVLRREISRRPRLKKLKTMSGIFGALASFPLALLQGGINDWNDAKSRARDWEYYKLQSGLDAYYNRQQMQYAQEMAQQQYQFEFDHEAPAVRAQQYRQAGLNPGLMYSSGATGMQGSVSSPPPATTRGHMPNKSIQNPQLASMLSTMAQLSQVETTRDLQKAQADYYRSEAEANRGETKPSIAQINLADAQAESARMLAKLNEQKALNETQMRDIREFAFELDKKYSDKERDQQLKNLTMAYDVSAEQLKKLINENSLFPLRQQELLNILALQTAQIFESYARSALLKAQKEGQDITNDKLESELQVLQATIPDMIVQIVADAASADAQAALLTNAVRDYEANWWNGVINDYLNSLGRSILVGIGSYASMRMGRGSTPTGQPTAGRLSPPTTK